MSSSNLVSALVKKTSLKSEQIQNILKLLDEGSTIPFIARYRKEMTGGADDEVLREFETIYLSSKKLLERKEEVSRLIAERATLTDSIRRSIEEADDLRTLESIYRPYKEKKSSRSTVAIAKGLSSLANILQSARLSKNDLMNEAKRFVKKDVTSLDEAIKGAQDILAERYSEQVREREAI
ncbi:RNA-binding transcriptional accessory protein, partial [Sulfurimonas sp. SAG-AH-194-C20]